MCSSKSPNSFSISVFPCFCSPLITANFSISASVSCAAPPVAFKIPSSFANCLSALPAVVIADLRANANPAIARVVIAVFNPTLPIIVPKDVILPATGPNGPCIAAIDCDALLNLS